MTTRNILLALIIGLLFSIKTYGQDIHSHNIYFPNNETDINIKDSEILDRFIDSLEISTHCKILITGYADNVGNEKLNYSLSEKRAISVRNYLLSKDILTENLTIQTSGPVLDPNKNKNENERQFNRRVEIKVSCDLEKKVDFKSIASSNPNFENDTIIKGKNGTELKIKKGAFYPIKIKDVNIQIKELSSYCDSIPDDVETLTDNGICLASGGMAFISATYKKKPVKKSFKDAFEVKIPIQQNDSTMDFYIAVKQKNGKIRWKKSDGKMITENGKKYYVYETNYISSFGMNCDRIIPGCNIDNENVFIIKTWVKRTTVKYYFKNKFSFYSAKPISKRRVSIPATINPDDIYIEVEGFKVFSLRHYRQKKFGPFYETKQVYALSELKYNPRKKQYKLKAKYFKPKDPNIKTRQIKKFMNCN